MVGLPDPEWGERLQAFVIGDPNLSEAIFSHCRERLAPYKRPKGVTFLDALPRNAGGKILKRQLRESTGEQRD